MKIEEIHDMWEKDSKIDATQLDVEALNISTIASKYMKLFTRERAQYHMLQAEYKKLKFEKWIFYTQGPTEYSKEQGWHYPGGIILKNETGNYLDSDPDLTKLGLKIAYTNEKLDLLKSIIDSLNKRSFQIKNAIDFLKWTNGQ
jgi:hypothetical protein